MLLFSNELLFFYISLNELVVSPQHDQEKTNDIKQKYIDRSGSKNAK
jgi:hypothetical protein